MSLEAIHNFLEDLNESDNLYNDPVGTASANFMEFRGIRPQMYIKYLLW